MGWGEIWGESWRKSDKTEEAAPIEDRKRKSKLEQKRENRGSCSNCGQEVKKQVGAKERKQRKLLQLRTGSEKASWGKREKTEEVAPIADRKRKSELEQK
ncbi:MAG: hypothetical protein J6C99_05795 [Lachnospiraceae bacterium]|nr:hypothetical protein [Lachnospiraceae bacterium]